jgi:hypothetical protein
VTLREVLLFQINILQDLVPTLFQMRMVIKIQSLLLKRRLTARSEPTTISTEEATVYLATKAITALLLQLLSAWSTVPLEHTAFHPLLAKEVQMVQLRYSVMAVDLGYTNSALLVLTTLTHISRPRNRLASCAHQVNTVRPLVSSTPLVTVIPVISACNRHHQDLLLLIQSQMECVSGSVLLVITVRVVQLIPLPAQPALT